MSEIDNEILTELKKSSDRGARLLVNTYSIFLLEIATGVFKRSSDDAQAAVTQTLANAVNKIGGFENRGEHALRNWLVTILKNEIINIQREQAKHSKHEVFAAFLENTARSDDAENITFAESEERVSIEDIDDIDPSDLTEETRNYLEFEADESDPLREKQLEVISRVMNSFNTEEKNYLTDRLLMGHTPKEIAKRRGTTIEATKKYILRLEKKFFKKIGEELQKDWNSIYEDFKRERSQVTSRSNSTR